MGRLNHHSKERIVKLKEEGYKPSQILRILEGEGVEISRVGLWKFLERFKQNQTLSTAPPQRKQSVPTDVLNFIDRQMESNDELKLLCIYIDCAELYGISEQNFNPAGRDFYPVGRDTGLLTFLWSVP
jgi:hypothetical protein